MTLTEPECEDLLTAVAASGRQLTVGFNRRFAPDYVRLKGGAVVPIDLGALPLGSAEAAG
jgi:hypothetical protein